MVVQYYWGTTTPTLPKEQIKEQKHVKYRHKQNKTHDI